MKRRSNERRPPFAAWRWACEVNMWVIFISQVRWPVQRCLGYWPYKQNHVSRDRCPLNIMTLKPCMSRLRHSVIWLLHCSLIRIVMLANYMMVYAPTKTCVLFPGHDADWFCQDHRIERICASLQLHIKLTFGIKCPVKCHVCAWTWPEGYIHPASHSRNSLTCFFLFFVFTFLIVKQHRLPRC